jgi:mannitol/fructose-specific phosphotransferase system IIA component (Ntr-type)
MQTGMKATREPQAPDATHSLGCLASMLSEAQITADLRATNRWEAIDELISHLVETGRIKSEHRNAITAVVRRRESSMSTGIGFGIGIPHASTDLISAAVASLGRSKRGIQFDALDGQPVKLVILFLIPPRQFQKHLHTVAGIAKLLHIPDFRQALEQAPDAATILQIIKGQPSTCFGSDESV